MRELPEDRDTAIQNLLGLVDFLESENRKKDELLEMWCRHLNELDPEGEWVYEREEVEAVQVVTREPEDEGRELLLSFRSEIDRTYGETARVWKENQEQKAEIAWMKGILGDHDRRWAMVEKLLDMDLWQIRQATRKGVSEIVNAT